jgi:hydroxymethylbilane synthase
MKKDSAAPRTIRIGTRGSALALTQTEIVRSALVANDADLAVEIVRIVTVGDRILDRPLATLGERGLFVSEIEEALREGRIDIAVHSAKDLPSRMPADMRIAAYLPRADARDAFVSMDADLWGIPAGARVGTSSPRRTCQLRAIRPDLKILDVRGNVDTRIRKLVDGQYDALLLACAGIDRLGPERLAGGTQMIRLSPSLMLPAPGQGALAIETWNGREDLDALLKPLSDPYTECAVRAERAFLESVGGGCSSAIAAFAKVVGARLHVRAMIGSIDGQMVRDEIDAPLADGEMAARGLAADLLERGGLALLNSAPADVARHDP